MSILSISYKKISYTNESIVALIMTKPDRSSCRLKGSLSLKDKS